MVKIKSIWINLTSVCNNRCQYCYDAGNSANNISIDMFDEIINLIKPLHIERLLLIGGEPTLHPEFFELANKCKDVAESLTVVTNGTRFHDRDFCMQLDKTPVTAVLMSLLGHNSLLHDNLTGRSGSFYELIEGFKNVSELTPKIKLFPTTTINSINQDYLKEILDFSKDIGAKEVIYNVCIPSFESDEVCVDPAKIASLIEDLYLHSKKKKVHLKINSNLPRCIFNQQIFNELFDANRIICVPCQLYRGNGYMLLSDGSLVSCTHLYNDILINPITLNFSSADLLSWFNSEEANAKRASHWKYPSQECTICSKWLKQCIGGCPITWTKYDSNKYLKAIVEAT